MAHSIIHLYVHFNISVIRLVVIRMGEYREENAKHLFE